MTLPDKEEISMPTQKQQKTEKCVGQCMAKVLVRARDDGRLVCGVFECASHLEQSPELAMVCLLPETGANDVITSMQHKLIQAYCLENDIPVIKITSCEALSKVLNDAGNQKSEKDNPVTSPSLDTSCVLVEWPPKTMTNKHEHRLLDLVWTQQVIDLPA